MDALRRSIGGEPKAEKKPKADTVTTAPAKKAEPSKTKTSAAPEKKAAKSKKT